MSFPDDELLIIGMVLDEENEKEQGKERKWVHRSWKNRETEGELSTLHKELVDDGATFFEFSREYS